MKTTTSERINGFDALRSIAMWLGVVLHAIIAYKNVPEKGWPDDNSVNLYILDWAYDTIHSFRMPLFFLVAGFFARMVIIRSGANHFVKQRIKRILIPFLVGIVVLVPLTMLPFHFYRYHYAQRMDLEIALEQSFQEFFKWNGVAHLWFLYYLILFSAASVCFLLLPGYWRMNFAERLKPYIHRISLLHLFLLCAFLFVLLLWQQAVVPPVYTGLKPQLYHFLYYGFFYFLGWIFQINMKSIPSLGLNAVWLTGFGVVLSIAIFLFSKSLPYYLYFLMYAFQTITLMFGIVGLMMRYANSQSASWRYFSDSAYWVYLSHMGIVAFLQVVLLNSGINVWLRLPLVLIATFIFCMGTYHFLVRFTIIGIYLHGKREKKRAATPFFFHKKIAGAKKAV